MEKLSAKTNAINWFEISVNDAIRAKKFYESIFEIEMKTIEMSGMEMIFFPSSENMEGLVSGALVKGEMHKPSIDGTVIYLNANPDIQVIIDNIKANGGKIIMPRTLVNEQVGYMAFFIDTEGNRLALHAAN
ncbi:MAG: VOC family protein [Bacteroidia bacterium]|nr:VOC family protein [Bacteroidia bacterium]